MNCQSVFFPQNVYILCLYLSKRKLFDLLYLQNVWMLEVCLMYLAVWIVWLIISSECVTAGSLPDVSGSMNCTLLSSCIAFDCCIESPRLGRKLHAAIDIDSCHARMTVTIEKLNFNVGLMEKQYGKLASWK